MGNRHRGPPGRRRQPALGLVGLGAAPRLTRGGTQRRCHRPLPAICRRPATAGRCGDPGVPFLDRVGQNRAGRGSVRPRRPSALPPDGRDRPCDRFDAVRHAQPLHAAGLARRSRRMAPPRCPSAIRRVLHPRGCRARRPGGLVLHDKRTGDRGLRRLPGRVGLPARRYRPRGLDRCYRGPAVGSSARPRRRQDHASRSDGGCDAFDDRVHRIRGRPAPRRLRARSHGGPLPRGVRPRRLRRCPDLYPPGAQRASASPPHS